MKHNNIFKEFTAVA